MKDRWTVGSLFWIALAASLFGVIVADVTGLNRQACFVLSSAFYGTFLPSIALVAFLIGVSLGQGSRPFADNEMPSYSGWSSHWRKVRRPVIRGAVLALLVSLWSLYYVPLALPYVARNEIDESHAIQRVRDPIRSPTFCDLFVYFEIHNGKSEGVCVQRRGRSLFETYPAESFAAGDRVRVIGRTTSLGSVVDRIERL